MKKIVWILLIFTLMLPAKELCIVASKSFPLNHISRTTLKAIFLDKKHLIRGEKILPINYNFHHPLRKCFEKNILRKSRRSLERYWLRAHYNGKRPPKVVSSSATLLEYLQKVPGAIGYIDTKSSHNPALKILLRVPCN